MRKLYLLLLNIIFLALHVSIVAAQSETLNGRIAYIGTDYNVYVEDFEDETTITLTNDAADETSRIYEMPTWATDGRLAYFSRERAGSAIRMGAYVARALDDDGVLIFEATNRFLNYAYWSPANCDDGENCRDLALLLSDETSLAVELIRDSDEDAESLTIGEGRPFYFTWSSDGTQMLWQRNTRQLDVYDVEEVEITETLDAAPGYFQTPAWSPVDDRLLFGVLNDELTDLTVYIEGEETILASELEGVVSFAWSPDGRYVAYTESYGTLIVVDSETGEVVTQTLEDGVYAFFWSPNSETLAYVTLASRQNSSSAKRLQESGGLAWSVIDVPGGEERHFAAFFPTSDMLYLLTYFDQFAHSHSVWSPDSRYLVYSELTANRESLIQIVDTRENNAEPETIADGVIGIWSFE